MRLRLFADAGVLDLLALALERFVVHFHLMALALYTACLERVGSDARALGRLRVLLVQHIDLLLTQKLGLAHVDVLKRHLLLLAVPLPLLILSRLLVVALPLLLSSDLLLVLPGVRVFGDALILCLLVLVLSGLGGDLLLARGRLHRLLGAPLLLRGRLLLHGLGGIVLLRLPRVVLLVKRHFLQLRIELVDLGLFIEIHLHRLLEGSLRLVAFVLGLRRLHVRNHDLVAAILLRLLDDDLVIGLILLNAVVVRVAALMAP